MFKYNPENYRPSMEWIVEDDNELIRQKSTELDINNITDYDNEMINKMISYIDACYFKKYKKYKIKSGVAITGVQIGYLKRVTYLHYYDDELNSEIKYLIANPKFVFKSSIKSYLGAGEGCLSVKKDRNGYVPRNYEIKILAFDLLLNKEIEIEVSNFLAICLQHEIDHMDGILYYDRINIFDPYKHEEEWKEIK